MRDDLIKDILKFIYFFKHTLWYLKNCGTTSFKYLKQYVFIKIFTSDFLKLLYNQKTKYNQKSFLN